MNPIPETPEGEEWDVIVIGTGMGGGVAGFELARSGRRVLFLERGLILHRFAPNDEPAPSELPIEPFLRSGRWPEPLRGQTTFGPVDYMAPRGCGTGGSTGLYAAQLERFRASDFRPRAWYPEAADANLPESWPVSIDEMQPFYRRAEALFRVKGTADPLEADVEAALGMPPALSERDAAIFEGLREAGLHPYRSHVALAGLEHCQDCSDVCPVGCKGDAGNRCLVPAVRDHGASFLSRCEVVELRTEGRRVSGVAARWRGKEIVLRGKAVVLAAGAWLTPALLLRSGGARWPEGLANSSGQVGRNLMLHATDLVALDPGQELGATGPRKALTLNDFYDDEGQKLGTLQSVGRPVDAASLEAIMRAFGTRDPGRWIRSRPGFPARAARMGAERLRRSSLMATIVEDLPYADNRIIPDPKSTLRFEYRYREELLARNRRFRQRLREVLSPRMTVHVIPMGPGNLNYGHVCGTCRFGHEPGDSVLDKTNRTHDIDNLYVTDTSFFPSSGATNPSLTVAANALRVGGIIHDRL